MSIGNSLPNLKALAAIIDSQDRVVMSFGVTDRITSTYETVNSACISFRLNSDVVHVSR